MKKIYFIWLSLIAVAFFSCTKYTNYVTDTTTTPVDTTTVTAPTVPPKIKFYNVMDYGSTDVYLNGTKITSVAKYYSSVYISAKEGANNIKLSFPGKSSLLDINPTLVLNGLYSCFFYKVGNEWKTSLIKDEYTTPASGFAAIRVLDFRTQGYFDYINVRITSPGSETFDFKNRNFLDHNTYDSYTKFKTIVAGSYNFYMYNDTVTSSIRKGVTIDNQGVYSAILTTPSNITPASNAIFYITPDVAKHY